MKSLSIFAAFSAFGLATSFSVGDAAAAKACEYAPVGTFLCLSQVSFVTCTGTKTGDKEMFVPRGTTCIQASRDSGKVDRIEAGIAPAPSSFFLKYPSIASPLVIVPVASPAAPPAAPPASPPPVSSSIATVVAPKTGADESKLRNLSAGAGGVV